MEEKKNTSPKDTDELDILVEGTSKPEQLKKTRAIPQVARKSQANGDDKKSTVVSDTVVQPPVKSTAGAQPADGKTTVTPTVKPTRAIPTVKNTAAAPERNVKNEVKQEESSSSDNKKENVKKESGNGILSGIAKALIYIVAVIGISALISYYGIKFANDIFAFVKDEASAEITISENMTLSEYADLLHSKNIIEYPGVFKFYTWYRNRNSSSELQFAEGTYTVLSKQNYDQLISTVRKRSGTRHIVTLTFKEGLTVDETIKIFTDAGVGDRDKFIDAINNYDYDYRFVKELNDWESIPGRKYRLEGYLYPDTYDFYTDSDESFIISKLLSNFDRKFEDEYYDRCTALGYTVDQMITLASVIEKEGYLLEDLATISSVFHNRLSKWANPYLQSDATIQYSFDTRKKEITAADKEIDSPYNSYMYKGLPPSAIANPGLESILAALYPNETNYYYFVTYKNGAAIFSRTLGEHNNAVAKVRSSSQNSDESSEAALAETDNIID